MSRIDPKTDPNRTRADLENVRGYLWQAIEVAEPNQLPALVAQLRLTLRDLQALEVEEQPEETTAQRLRRERAERKRKAG